MDNYYEQQVYENGNLSKNQAKFFMYGGVGLSLFAAAMVCLVSAINDQLYLLLIFTVVFALAGIYLFLKKDEAYVEYEYVYSLGELSIAKIINNKRRKELCKLECKDIEVFGKTTAKNYNRYSTMPDAKKERATFIKKGEVSENVYFLVYVSPKGKTVLTFEPDEELLLNIKKHLRVSIEL